MPFDIWFIGVSIFFTSALTTATSFGGGTLLLTLMLQFLPLGVAIPVHGAVQSVSNGWRVWLFRENIQWAIMLRFGLSLPLGICIGLWFFQELPNGFLQLFIGVFILSTLILQSVEFFRQKEFPLSFFVPIGLLVGVLNIVVGVVGPILSLLLVGRRLGRQSIVATISVISLLGYLFKVIGFVLIGFNFAQYGIAIVSMVPSIVLGTILGRHMLGRINDSIFRIMVRAMVAVLALKLVLWDGVLNGTWW